MARKHPSEPAVGHRLRACRCPEHDDSSSRRVHLRWLRATLGAKIGDAVFARTVDLTKPRASGENTRHGVRIADIVVMGQ